MTDNVDNWEDFFKNFSYKPNWEFDYAHDIDFDRKRVVITMRVPDSRAPLPDVEQLRWGVRKTIPLVPITKSVRLDPWHGEEYAKHLMRSHIREMEDHEIDEWFRYKGELVFDPHKEKMSSE